jgi:FtsP/CotA-like multicopper oxidase with cupredoxin domain
VYHCSPTLPLTRVLWKSRNPGKWLIHCPIGHHTTNNHVEEQGGGGLMLMMIIDVRA